MKYILTAFIILIVLNAIVTAKVVMSDSYTNKQKMIQIILTWLIPILGALVVLAFNKDDETPKGPDKPEFGEGDNIGMSGMQ